MSPEQRTFMRRAEAKQLALLRVANILAPLVEAGFHGKLPLELDLQDGVVTTVRNKGPEQTFKIVSDRRAA